MTTTKVRVQAVTLLFGLLAAGSAEAMTQENGLSRNGWRTNGVNLNGACLQTAPTDAATRSITSCGVSGSQLDLGALVVRAVKLPTPAGQPR
jgi:hypothetical protein